MSGYTGESEYIRRLQKHEEARFEAEQHKRNFERKYRQAIEGGMSENEFMQAAGFRETLDDYRDLKAQLEAEAAQDEAFMKGWNSVPLPYGYRNNEGADNG